MRCDNCGYREFRIASLPEGKLELCELCDHPHGASHLVTGWLDRQEAHEANVEYAIWPLYKVFAGWKEVRVGKSSAGDPALKIPPYLYFSVHRNTLKPIEKLSITLELSARKMASRWVIEAAYDKQLRFTLRPMFFGLSARKLPEAIAKAQKDIPTLAASLDRDMNLHWWSQS